MDAGTNRSSERIDLNVNQRGCTEDPKRMQGGRLTGNTFLTHPLFWQVFFDRCTPQLEIDPSGCSFLTTKPCRNSQEGG